ncbi:TOMM precursor leader peptide-binding protein, partial [uncultured Leifsonia sp.]|uniref:TOMM precursor leader peptide-binding protein n=1 Tax=uncultured Leifsonia sp. TaxID=340359 RepID=UPI0028D8D2DF
LALLREAGVEVHAGPAGDDAVDRADTAVLVGAYAIAPRRHQRWLRRDVPHLPVVFGDLAVGVGPFVTPGSGPCLRCADLHRRDRDPAWPAIAAQLHVRPAPGETELICGAVGSVAAGAVLAHLAGDALPVGTALRFDRRTLRWSEETRTPHPECGCLSPAAPPWPPVPARPGTGTAAGRTGVPAGCRAWTS